MTNLKNQKGISLIITFFIMIIILVVVLSVSLLLYGEIKVIRNIGNSMVSFYAADSGIEKVLYYDRQVLVTGQDDMGNDILLRRGLCFMLDEANNSNYCRETEEGAIYCKDPELIGDCNINTCDECTISFNTTFDQKSYFVEATVNNSENIYLNIESSGTFGGAGRKIEIISPLNP